MGDRIKEGDKASDFADQYRRSKEAFESMAATDRLVARIAATVKRANNEVIEAENDALRRQALDGHDCPAWGPCPVCEIISEWWEGVRQG